MNFEEKLNIVAENYAKNAIKNDEDIIHYLRNIYKQGFQDAAKKTLHYIKKSPCDFCQNIYNLNEIDNYHKWDLPYTFIVKNSQNNFGLYNRCDDDYYSCWACDIKYCPKCGRKLNENY